MGRAGTPLTCPVRKQTKPMTPVSLQLGCVSRWLLSEAALREQLSADSFHPSLSKGPVVNISQPLTQGQRPAAHLGLLICRTVRTAGSTGPEGVWTPILGQGLLNITTGKATIHCLSRGPGPALAQQAQQPFLPVFSVSGQRASRTRGLSSELHANIT